jgi:hypothetical protein
LFQSCLGPMLAAGVGIHDDDTLKRFQLSDDRVRIFLFGEMPEPLYPELEYAAAPDAAVPAKRAGHVVYMFDVVPPE